MEAARPPVSRSDPVAAGGDRQPAKGAAFVVAGVVLGWLSSRAMPSDLLTPTPLEANLLILLCLLLGIWLWSLIDAWRAAGR